MPRFLIPNPNPKQPDDMNTDKMPPVYSDGRPFYRIVPIHDGLVDIWLTPGEAVPAYDNLTGRTDFSIRVLAVREIDPDDPQWGGDLEGHIRWHYDAWLRCAEVIEI